MGESLIERRRVQDEGLRIVNCFYVLERCLSSIYCIALDGANLRQIRDAKSERISESRCVSDEQQGSWLKFARPEGEANKKPTASLLLLGVSLRLIHPRCRVSHSVFLSAFK